VNELGSNYPTELWDPNIFKEDEYYDKLYEAQQNMTISLENKNLNRTTVEFVPQTSEKTQPNKSDTKRKTKWDETDDPVPESQTANPKVTQAPNPKPEPKNELSVYREYLVNKKKMLG